MLGSRYSVSTRFTALGLAAVGALALVAGADAAVAPVASSPLNVSFADIGVNSDSTIGNGNVNTGTFSSPNGGVYDTQFTDDSGVVTSNSSGLSFDSEDITLDYSPTGFVDLPQPTEVTLADTFTGTDVLTTSAGQTLDLALSGTYSGPNGYIGLGGASLVFTGTGTITGGTLGLTGSAPFNATEIEAEVSSAVPAGVVQPQQQPPGTAGYTANYGALVPEPSSFALLGLGALPLFLVVRRKAQALRSA